MRKNPEIEFVYAPDLSQIIFVHGCPRIYTDVFLMLKASGKDQRSSTIE